MSTAERSITEVPYTIIAAIKGADAILGANRIWKSTNLQQKYFLDNFYLICQDESQKMEEIESIASRKAEEINKFLEKHGYPGQFQPFGHDQIGIASVLDILVEWTKKGGNVTIETPDRRKFPGVSIGKGQVRFYRSPNHDNPIACLLTKPQFPKPDKVIYMTMLDNPANGKTGIFVLHKKIQEIKKGWEICYDFGGLKFPKVDLRQNANVNWILGINTMAEQGVPAIIAQAQQENRLRINEVGARAQSVFTGMMVLGATAEVQKPDYIINRPFLFWIEEEKSNLGSKKEGKKKPLFTAWIIEKDWKDPGNIKS